MNNRRQLIQHNGKTLIIHNYNGLSGQEYVDAIEYNGREGKSLNAGERLILIDVTNSIVDKEVIKAFKRVSHNASTHLSKTAVVGVTGIQKMFIKTVSSFSNLNVQAFGTQEEAIQWLTS